MHRRNHGLDFCSYAEVLALLGGIDAARALYQYFIFINDTVRGPFVPAYLRAMTSSASQWLWLVVSALDSVVPYAAEEAAAPVDGPRESSRAAEQARQHSRSSGLGGHADDDGNGDGNGDGDGDGNGDGIGDGNGGGDGDGRDVYTDSAAERRAGAHRTGASPVRRIKLVGSYLSSGHKYMPAHVQSMAFAVDAEGLDIVRHSLRCIDSAAKDLIILYGEVAMSTAVMRANCAVASFIDGYDGVDWAAAGEKRSVRMDECHCVHVCVGVWWC